MSSFVQNWNIMFIFTNHIINKQITRMKLSQNSFMSFILYLFFNAGLLKLINKLKIKIITINFVNNVNLLVYEKFTKKILQFWNAFILLSFHEYVMTWFLFLKNMNWFIFHIKKTLSAEKQKLNMFKMSHTSSGGTHACDKPANTSLSTEIKNYLLKMKNIENTKTLNLLKHMKQMMKKLKTHIIMKNKNINALNKMTETMQKISQKKDSLKKKIQAPAKKNLLKRCII